MKQISCSTKSKKSKFGSMTFSLTAVTVRKECAPSGPELHKSAFNKLFTTVLFFGVVTRALKLCNV